MAVIRHQMRARLGIWVEKLIPNNLRLPSSNKLELDPMMKNTATLVIHCLREGRQTCDVPL